MNKNMTQLTQSQASIMVPFIKELQDQQIVSVQVTHVALSRLISEHVST